MDITVNRVPELAVTLYSNFFKVTGMLPRGRSAVVAFTRRYIEYTLRKRRGRPGFDEVPDCTFATRTEDKSEYRFHINQLPDFKDMLRSYDILEGNIKWSQMEMYKPRKVNLVVRHGWVPDVKYRQPEAIAFLEAPEPNIKLLAMHTGYGKSYSTMQAVANTGDLAVWSVQAKYITKTCEDLIKVYDVTMEDVLVIRNGKDLKMLLAMWPIECKVIVVSSKLIQIWVSLYERLGQAIEGIGYSCMPEEFYPLLGAGVRIIDEAHQEFHFNFKQDLYTHAPRSYSLSATMLSDSAFRNRMYMLAYPQANRFEVEYIPYISATSVTYEFEKPEKIRVTGPQGTYSHHVFEESLMKDKKVLAGYVNMVKLVVDKELLNDRLEGERMLIYAAGVEFCTYLVERLRDMFPHLKIERYCGTMKDPYSNLVGSDISVTTLGSAGANVDIPNLKCVLLTTAVDSSQSNIQGFGRLRDKLKPGRIPRFIWFTCEQIARHMVYHDKKVSILTRRAKTLNSQYYGLPL